MDVGRSDWHTRRGRREWTGSGREGVLAAGAAGAAGGRQVSLSYSVEFHRLADEALFWRLGALYRKHGPAWARRQDDGRLMRFRAEGLVQPVTPREDAGPRWADHARR